MTKPEISFEMRKALIAAAHANNIDGPRGRALLVIQTWNGCGTEYVPHRHVVLVAGRYIPVAGAVDIANEILLNADLGTHRIDYPGAKYQSPWLNGANDNTPLAGTRPVRADHMGGV
ncbi:hypothetical protein [Thalassospira lohafexi]|uniref:Uncharacterized protein n=1 Tax=Thalassospira lohafexi TaxID=744227 RepID=A0A2N3L468_9PROT|nr:hypothetical protein [Thalassospira lohafexi]PKR57480.1 hypothetical protein COO92_16190 [Thalassospira lohafexi]